MLCFVCLAENRETPSKAECFVQGTSICREHVTAVGKSDLLSFTYKLNELARRWKEGNTNGGKSAASDNDESASVGDVDQSGRS